MINHPMLLTRDPPPEIDVTRPALSKNRPFSQRYGYTDAEGKPTAKGLATLTDSAAQASESIRETGGTKCGTAPRLDAADLFKAGDRVMWYHVCGSKEWRRGIYSAACSSNIVCRRPTPAELAQHWPDDGWIEWKGGTCPVGGMTRVQIRCRNPELETKDTVRMADHFRWNHLNKHGNGDIIAYKVLS